jgi:hypothetical protein
MPLRGRLRAVDMPSRGRLGLGEAAGRRSARGRTGPGSSPARDPPKKIFGHARVRKKVTSSPQLADKSPSKNFWSHEGPKKSRHAVEGSVRRPQKNFEMK